MTSYSSSLKAGFAAGIPRALKLGTTDSRMVAESDGDLVKRFLTGDLGAFGEIVRRYRPVLYRQAIRFLRDKRDAEEVVQDTLVRAYRGLHRFRGDSSLATWLHLIARNLATNRYWHNDRRKHRDSTSLDDPLNEQTGGTWHEILPSEEAGPAQEVAISDFTSAVSSCMDQLDACDREILELRAHQDLSYEQIAEMLQLKVGTVKSRLGRAREKLRQLLLKDSPEFFTDTTAAPSPAMLHAQVQPAA